MTIGFTEALHQRRRTRTLEILPKILEQYKRANIVKHVKAMRKRNQT